MAENLDPSLLAQLSEEYRRQSESMRESTLIADAQAKAEKAKLDINKGFTTAVSATTTVFQASTKAVESFTRSLTSGESSFKQIASIGSVAADIATDVAKQFGALGGLAGAAIQAASKLAQAMAAQAEAVVKTKDQVAKFGAAGALSSDKLFELANNAGYYSLNMNKLYAAAGKAGGDLLIFSKNMSGGVETFAKMAAVGEPTLQAFNKLGIGQQELAEYQADYVKYLASSGIQLNANQKTQAALTKGSLEYTKNVLELSALTGKDVDTVKKKQQEAQASLDIQIHYGKLQARAAELRLAGDKASLEEAAALEAQIEKEKAIIEKVALTYDAATTAAVRNALATGGSFTEISSNLAAAGVDIGKLVRLAKDQSLTAGQASAAATEEIAAGVKRSLTNFGTSMIYTGDSLGKQVLGSIENNAAIAKGAAEAIENQKIVADQIANPTGDYLKSMQNAFDQFTRKAQQEGDKILSGVNPFMTDMATVMKNAKKIMEEAWEFMKKNVLEPANKYIKDMFGVDLMAITKTVIETLGTLATSAWNLWNKFDNLTSITEKLLIALGALVGFVVGSALGPLGAVAGAMIGTGATGYLLTKDKVPPKPPGPTTSEASSAWGKVGIPGKKPSDKFDSGAGSGWDNEPTGSKGTSTKTRSSLPSSSASNTSNGSLKGDTTGLDPELHKRLMAAAEVYGKPLTINSGFRSYEKQKAEYDKSVAAGTPGVGPGGMLVAKPGSSNHERGMAVDIQEYRDPKAVEALKSQGLVQRYGNADAVHFEIAGSKPDSASRISSAPVQTASAPPIEPEVPKPKSSAPVQTVSAPPIEPEVPKPKSSAPVQTVSAPPIEPKVIKPQLETKSKPAPIIAASAPPIEPEVTKPQLETKPKPETKSKSAPIITASAPPIEPEVPKSRSATAPIIAASAPPIEPEIPKPQLETKPKPETKSKPAPIIAASAPPIEPEIPKPQLETKPKPETKSKPAPIIAASAESVEPEIPKPQLETKPKPETKSKPAPIIAASAESVEPEIPKPKPSSAPMRTVSSTPVNTVLATPEPALSAKPAPKPDVPPLTRSLSSSGSSVSNSEETYARMLYDIKDSITTKMQEMIDKVSESNDLLGKIMRHST
jgi:hypothetical protein